MNFLASSVTGVYHFASHASEKDITGQVNFTSHLDAVVTVAVSLVNSLTPGEARGRDYQPPIGGDLAAAVTTALRTGQPGARSVTAPEAADLVATAGQLRAVFDAVDGGQLDAAARQVNELLATTGARPQLDRHDGEPWHLHFHGTTDSLSQGWAAGCATGLAVVLGTDMYDRLGVCTAPRCNRVYVDISRNGTRRFCSTSCQNRVKAAAFRARAGK
jgi:predicted RNA-binding Zn ribbon-like protein